jgi:ABC-2 type transport system ATP-binding protein
LTASEPMIVLEDLRRTFTVRQKIGRVRRQMRVVHAVDGITASIMAGEAVGYIGANEPESRPPSRC